MAEVVLYTTGTCPYCIRAKMLLDKKGVGFSEIRVDQEQARYPEMVQKAGGLTSVPQIFIDGRHVGGCDDLYELDFDGELDPLLGLGG